MVEFRIRTSGKECLDCRKRFQVGEKFFSLLQLDDEIVASREDRCESCWEGFTPSTGAIWWRTGRREDKSGKSQVDFDSVKALFFQLMTDERPEISGLRYVAALLLIRKRVLKLIETIFGPQGEMMRLEFPKGEGRVYAVPVPALDQEGLERLKDSLKQALTLES